MTKESRYHIEQQDVIFYEPFLDEFSVRRNGGVPTDVTFDKGVASFDGTSSVIIYGNQYLNPAGFSVRVKLNKTDLSDNEYFLMKRTDDDVGFIFFVIDADLYFYSGGALTANAATIALTETEIEVVGVYDGTNTKVYVNGVVGTDAGSPLPADQFSTDMYAGQNYGGGVTKYEGDIDLIEIYNKGLTQSEIQNLAGV